MIFNAETRSMKFVPFLISSAITILLIIFTQYQVGFRAPSWRVPEPTAWLLAEC